MAALALGKYRERIPAGLSGSRGPERSRGSLGDGRETKKPDSADEPKFRSTTSAKN